MGNPVSLFDPCVNALGQQPYWLSCMEASYCTSGFRAIIRDDLRTLPLLHVLLRDNLYARVISVHVGKATHANRNCLAGLASRKIWRYNNSPPYVMARWPPQQIPLLNFLGTDLLFQFCTGQHPAINLEEQLVIFPLVQHSKMSRFREMHQLVRL